MDTNVSDFMDALSQCCDRENYLSDVTYALCESNQKFMQFFLDFFFKDKDIDANQVSISREYRFEDSRPDFLIEKRDPHEFFIVEVKINDRNHHFKQYKDTLEKLHKEASKGGKYQPKDFKQHIGYIANYRITPQEVREARGFKRIRTWQKFYDALKDACWLGDEVIKGYGQLCKAVCGFVDVSKYTIELEYFDRVKETWKWLKDDLFTAEMCPKDVCSYDGYYQQACTKYWRIGRFFELKKYKKGKSVWGWIGIYLVEEGAQCVIAFENRAGWGDLVCKDFKEKARVEYTIEYDEYDKCLYFYMNDTVNGFTIDNLKKFFASVISYIKDKDERAFVCKRQKLINCNEWLSMLKLPALIKSEMFRGWSGCHYDVTIVENGMSAYEYARSISSLCVEWFKMSFKQEDKGRREFWGFVGVVWDKCEWIGDEVLCRLKDGKSKFVVCITGGLGKREREQLVEHHGWIKQMANNGSVVKIFKDADFKLGIENLRKRFQSTLKAILPIRQS